MATGYWYNRKTTFDHVKARWITGIHAIHWRKMPLTVPSNNRLDLHVMLELVEIPMSFCLEGCAWIVAGCTRWWDNQSKFVLWTTVSGACHVKAPFVHSVLSVLEMDRVQINQSIHPSILGQIKVDLIECAY